MDVSHSLALCRPAVFPSSGSGGIGYGYFLLEAIDPVDEEGDLAGDRVSVELDRGLNLFPLIFFLLPPMLPCQELLRGLPFSQMSEICFVSGILSLQE